MVKLLLSIKADLENVTNLEPASEDFDYFFEVKCNSCHEVHPKLVSMNRQEEYPLTTGKGSTAHFVWHCGTCKRESSAKFELSPPRPYSADSNGQFAPFIVLDCRGLELVGFDPRGTWKCKGVESGTVFSDVDLTDSEWTDYDEKVSQPVGIMGIESNWSRAP